MSTPTAPDYDAIAPLVAGTKDEASGVFVTFRCPATGTEVRSDGSWPADGLAERTAGQVKRGLLSSLRNTLAATVRNAVPSSSPVASVGVDATNQVIYGVGNEQAAQKHRSEHDRRAAICTAFSSVAHRFVWDERTNRFVAATSPSVQRSDFDALVGDHPLVNDYDRDVLIRLVAAIIVGDGQIADAERATFAAMFPGATLSADAASRAPGRVDFEETLPGLTRETILLLGWVVALTDDHVSAEEQALLDAAAAALGTPPERAAALATMARSHVVDQAIAALAAQGVAHDDIRPRIEALGEQIGLGRDEAARAFIRWTKRNG
ncbi:MAG: hypothetical protein JWM34_2186 [Ilumatobacteraceae bacterium]|nr:hypothetical protein [Ilumatobacteraceae bacterium]